MHSLTALLHELRSSVIGLPKLFRRCSTKSCRASREKKLQSTQSTKSAVKSQKRSKLCDAPCAIKTWFWLQKMLTAKNIYSWRVLAQNLCQPSAQLLGNCRPAATAAWFDLFLTCRVFTLRPFENPPWNSLCPKIYCSWENRKLSNSSRDLTSVGFLLL